MASDSGKKPETRFSGATFAESVEKKEKEEEEEEKEKDSDTDTEWGGLLKDTGAKRGPGHEMVKATGAAPKKKPKD